MKNKVILAALEGFFLPALCGVDRCYMGQPCVGACKGITFGGFAIWALFDYIVVAINMLGRNETISAFGFYAKFSLDDVTGAFWIMLVSLILSFSANCFLYCHRSGPFKTTLVNNDGNSAIDIKSAFADPTG